MIAAVGSILLTPWNLFNSPELIHYTRMCWGRLSVRCSVS